jgi:hypothetical protein
MTHRSSKKARHSVVELLDQHHDELNVISSDYEVDENGNEQFASHHSKDSDELEDEKDMHMQSPPMPSPPPTVSRK